jgi:hypothetical protein
MSTLIEMRKPLDKDLDDFAKMMRKLYSDINYGGSLKGSCDVCRFRVF